MSTCFSPSLSLAVSRYYFIYPLNFTHGTFWEHLSDFSLSLFGCLALTKRKVPQKDFDKFFPTSVRISNEGLELQGKEFDYTRDMVDVKKVYDYGEYYFITFYFPAKSQQFICQKDLLVSGTIEEFEGLFAGKIVRKKTKTKTAGENHPTDPFQSCEQFFAGKDYVKSISVSSSDTVTVVVFVSGLSMKVKSYGNDVYFNDVFFYNIDDQDLMGFYESLEDGAYVVFYNKRIDVGLSWEVKTDKARHIYTVRDVVKS